MEGLEQGKLLRYDCLISKAILSIQGHSIWGYAQVEAGRDQEMTLLSCKMRSEIWYWNSYTLAGTRNLTTTLAKLH